ncbi:MAG: NRDE family protein [Myxococcales bacterium]|nr:NRDE family protein [Myxococcales bacterium]
MCTILYLFGVHPELPLIVAANRDENYARAARPPGLIDGTPRVLAGSDLRAGGTWLGVNEDGIVVGLTNQRTLRLPRADAPSRGEVVLRALRARGIDEIVEQLHTLEPARYNAFNLLFGNAERLLAAYVRPELAEVEIETVAPGIGVLPNDRIGAPGFPKAERAIELSRPRAQAPWGELSKHLESILADHSLAPLEALPTPPPDSPFTRERLHAHSAICTHTESYGTCSATLIALGPDRLHSYLHADGPPCRARFSEYSDQLWQPSPGGT